MVDGPPKENRGTLDMSNERMTVMACGPGAGSDEARPVFSVGMKPELHVEYFGEAFGW
jgi:hypothetical protein